MSTHAQVAKQVRIHKEMNPHLYCKHCLWRVVHKNGKRTPCPKHMPKETQDGA